MSSMKEEYVFDYYTIYTRYTRAYARIRRFFDFCLHLFTIYPQLIVKQ